MSKQNDGILYYIRPHFHSLSLVPTVYGGWCRSMLLRSLYSLTDALLTDTWYEKRACLSHSPCPVLQLPSMSFAPSRLLIGNALPSP
jgi:hypothetical protein